MMPTRERSVCPMGQDVPAVQGGAAYLSDIERRLAPYFERAEPRQQALASLRGLLSPAERKNSWQLAEIRGAATPYAFQHLVRRARWDPEAVCDALHRYVVQPLGDSEAVLVIEKTGFLKKGRHSAGVVRQYSGTAGRIENCQIGVFLASASRLGHVLLDRDLYVPQEWTNDRDRGRRAGLPEERHLATTPPLARQMLARALATGVPAQWGTGDSVYGDDRRLRMWLEDCPQAYVLAVSGKDYVWVGWQQRHMKTVRAALPTHGWIRLGAGAGTKGPRWYDWLWLPLADPVDSQWRRWLLVRRRVSDPQERQAYVVFAPQDTSVGEVVRVAGTRWTIESYVEAAKSEVGLDHNEVRSWTGWYRPITLTLWALALLTVLRAEMIAVEALKKSLPPAQQSNSLAAFKASHGLTSRCVCPSCAGCGGTYA